MDVSNDKGAIQRLKEAAEKAKIELSSAATTTINIPYLAFDSSGPKHLVVQLPREKFEALIMDTINRTLQPLKNCLKDSGFVKYEIDEVLLVGGSTRVPKV